MCLTIDVGFPELASGWGLTSQGLTIAIGLQ
jgi:hypothetical protein